MILFMISVSNRNNAALINKTTCITNFPLDTTTVASKMYIILLASIYDDVLNGGSGLHVSCPINLCGLSTIFYSTINGLHTDCAIGVLNLI